jgi:hypothetical protein
MNDKSATKRKKKLAEPPVHEVTEGSVTASIWRRQSPAGFSYLDFSITRYYTSLSSGNTGSSKNFHARNRPEIIAVVEQASRWIIEHEARELQAEARVA